MPRNKFLSAITPEQETQIQAILDRTCARTLIGLAATLLETRAAQAREVERFAASEELATLASKLYQLANGARV